MFTLYNVIADEMLTSTGPDLDAVDVAVQFVNSSLYVLDAAHETIADVPEAARVGEPVVLTNSRCANGAFRADNVTVPMPGGSGTAHAAILCVHDGGTYDNSQLICYTDQSADLPFTADGNVRIVRWNAGEGTIFKLTHLLVPEA